MGLDGLTHDGGTGERVPPDACDWTAIDGVPLPVTLYARDPSLRGAFFCKDPLEVSFFVPRPAEEVARICAGTAPGVEPKRRVVADRYFDTPGRAFFRQGVSARLREYRRNVRPVHFEVIVVSWRGAVPAAPLRPRANRVLVQTFERNTAADRDILLAQYAAAGLVEVARVEKTRTAFDLLPVTAEAPGGATLAGVDGRLVEDLGSLRVTDLGLKVLVDELHGDPFAEPTIVEVEYDRAHEAHAAAVVERLRAELGPGVRPKERNKIAYLLADAAPLATDPRTDRGGDRG